MRRAMSLRLLLFVLSGIIGAVSPAVAQGRLGLAIAAGSSPYDLSGTGTGGAGAAFLAWRPLRGLVVEPGMTVFSYESQFDERTTVLLPELSVQGELRKLLGEMRVRAVHPWTGNTVDLIFGISRVLKD